MRLADVGFSMNCETVAGNMSNDDAKIGGIAQQEVDLQRRNGSVEETDSSPADPMVRAANIESECGADPLPRRR